MQERRLKDSEEIIHSSNDIESFNNLNVIQKSIIDGTIQYPLQDIIESLDPYLSIKALNTILSDESSDDVIGIFKEKTVWGSIEQIRSILSHPCPHNRNSSYEYVGQEEGYCMYKMDRDYISDTTTDGDIILKNGRLILKKYIVRNNPEKDNYIIAKEENGLLGLTSREDNITLPVTKDAVVAYINYLIKQEILNQQKKLDLIKDVKILIYTKIIFMGQDLTNFKINPHVITVMDFINIFFDKITQLYEFTIEKTEYTTKNKLESKDFQFYFCGKKFDFSSGTLLNMTFSEYLKTRSHSSEIKNEYTIHVARSVYEKNGYCLNRYVRTSPASLSKICLFKINEMIEEGKISNEDFLKISSIKK